MGKGYNNYMCKKPFHPGSKANIKRAWMAEQKTENEKKKQDELKVQYEKEQDLYNNRALISSESKDKLELNFMYEAPPGAKRERQKEDDEPEYKFEWQRKYNAPREDYAKGNEDIKDQPFGIPVRNVRCIKCHKWGHINTDKECPLYNQASTSSMPTTSMDPMELMRQMKEDGYGLKEHVLGHQLNPGAANQQFIISDESDPEMDFLKSLSSAEKRKLLRKLKKLSKKQSKSGHCKKKKSKKNKKSKSKDSSSSESEEEIKGKKQSKSSSSSSSDSESSSEKSVKKNKKKKSKHSNSSPSRDDKKIYSSSKESTKFKEEKSSHKKSSNHHLPSEVTREKDKSGRVKTGKDSPVNNSTHHMLKDMEVEGPLPPKKQDESPKRKKTKQGRRSECSPHNSEEESYKILSHNSPSRKDKQEKDSSSPSKRIKHETHNSGNSGDEEKCKHPDGFSHLCPQALIEENYLQSKTEYKGDVHDRFRHLNRDKRSPSVKHKYNK